MNGVRQGKVIELDLAATDKAAAETEVKAMCEKLLANTVIESYRVEIAERGAGRLTPGRCPHAAGFLNRRRNRRQTRDIWGQMKSAGLDPQVNAVFCPDRKVGDGHGVFGGDTGEAESADQQCQQKRSFDHRKARAGADAGPAEKGM